MLYTRYCVVRAPLRCTTGVDVQDCQIPLSVDVQVYDELALTDAEGLFRFLARRGFLSTPASSPLLATSLSLLRSPSPLTGVDMVKAPASGVVVRKKCS